MQDVDNSGIPFNLKGEAAAAIRQLAANSGKEINELVQLALGIIVIAGNLPEGQKIAIVRDDTETIKDLIVMGQTIKKNEMALIERLIASANPPNSLQRAIADLDFELPKGRLLPGISDGQMPSQ